MAAIEEAQELPRARFGARGRDFPARVAAHFRRIAAAEPDRVRVIDASREKDDVAASLLDALTDLLP